MLNTARTFGSNSLFSTTVYLFGHLKLFNQSTDFSKVFTSLVSSLTASSSCIYSLRGANGKLFSIDNIICGRVLETLAFVPPTQAGVRSCI